MRKIIENYKKYEQTHNTRICDEVLSTVCILRDDIDMCATFLTPICYWIFGLPTLDHWL